MSFDNKKGGYHIKPYNKEASTKKNIDTARIVAWL
jgi:hypothetical protein